MRTAAPLTRTEARIHRLLAAGATHEELIACLPDAECGSLHTVQQHIHNLRKKLPEGEAILHVTRNGPPYYIRVCLLTAAD